MKLNNGVEFPEIGLGAAIVPYGRLKNFKKAQAQRSIYRYALEKGCRLFDTSSAYGRNEEILGEVLMKQHQRDNAFLMVKISNREQREGNIAKAVDSALTRLRTDHLDLLMLHWPQTETYIDSWLQLEKLYKAGKTRALGVSNFHEHHLDALAEVASVVPAVNQIEVHPLFTQKPLIACCEKRGIQVVSYSPLGRMHDVLIKARTLSLLAGKYQKSVPQIILRWNIQLGIVPIPCTANPAHFDEFMNIFDFSLTPEEIAQIDALNENIRLRYNPDTCDFSIL